MTDPKPPKPTAADANAYAIAYDRASVKHAQARDIYHALLRGLSRDQLRIHIGARGIAGFSKASKAEILEKLGVPESNA